MLRFVYVLLIICMCMQTPFTGGGAMRFASEYRPAFTVSIVDDAFIERIAGVSWKPGCPVPIEDLRLLRVAYADFGQRVKAGELICHYLVADELAEIFAELYEAGFPIERIRLIDEYNADDLLSMDDNNSSAFNFRTVEGSSTLSKHAYGLAVDINPVQNPYTENNGAYVSPESGREFLNRGDIRPGMIVRGDVVYEAFTSRGWTWGGDWKYQIDYQHFQKDVPLEGTF